MLDVDNFEWSFSGLKTSALSKVKELHSNTQSLENVKLSDYKQISKNPKIKKAIPQLSAEIQEAIVDVLVEKTIRALKKYKPSSFLLAGGVAANLRLRNKFELRMMAERLQVKFHVPRVSLCTDNAAYIASCAFYNYQPVFVKNIISNPQLTITGET
jgi:N6-L-threonylcarbamoyladenine synthase